jgi:CO/xanthine dehydrogenase Mo-binding subunit
LLEEYVYNEDGQLLTSTFMDYLLPTIYEVPVDREEGAVHAVAVHAARREGVRRGRDAPTPAAIMCAINDALAPLGVKAHEVPASPNRVWN